jgi:hypothetical protein
MYLIKKAADLCSNFVKVLISCTLYLVNAPLAQLVECFHGKEKVNGSIPLGGSNKITKVLLIKY